MKRSGLTLVEVLVASSLMILLTAAVLATYHQGWRAFQVQDRSTEAYRAAMIILTHLRTSLRGVQVLTPSLGDPPSETLTYRYAALQGQDLAVDAQGLPLWSGLAKVTLAGTRATWQDQAGQPRVLGDLGSGGSMRFERPSPYLVRIVLVAARGASVYQISDALSLPNQ